MVDDDERRDTLMSLWVVAIGAVWQEDTLFAARSLYRQWKARHLNGYPRQIVHLWLHSTRGVLIWPLACRCCCVVVEGQAPPQAFAAREPKGWIM